MSKEFAYTGDTPNGLREAQELAAYQRSLRQEYLEKRHGSKERGKAALEAEESARAVR